MITDIIIFSCVLLIIISVISLLLVEKHNYVFRREFFVGKERELFLLLLKAFPDMYVFSRISALAILEPNLDNLSKRQLRKSMNTLRDNFFLFALYSKEDFSFVCAVEFATNPKEIERSNLSEGEVIQQILLKNKIITLRVSPFDFVDEQTLRSQLNELLYAFNLKPLKPIALKTTASEEKKNLQPISEKKEPTLNPFNNSLSNMFPEDSIQQQVLQRDPFVPSTFVPLSEEEEKALIDSDVTDTDNFERLSAINKVAEMPSQHSDTETHDVTHDTQPNKIAIGNRLRTQTNARDLLF